jgi:hypothetical protein
VAIWAAGARPWRAGRVWAAALTVAAALWLGAAGTVAAEAEWCDSGSPPPNDFRLQPTGGGSASSSPAWLKSTNNGGALLASATATGQVDVSQVPQLQGGVANGMNTALQAQAAAAARH